MTAVVRSFQLLGKNLDEQLYLTKKEMHAMFS